ncbi:MAG TPA: chromosome segregation protein SMC [Syntrophales bacterium]|nr:chromosome segregation protein SMC [Syntrophales bacterium]HPI57756.1 chromosome segregation protein SMC [Syntrophales bacterium]HPN25834.1 chromosome segregation protein SMC [Syntrophales bacterium]
MKLKKLEILGFKSFRDRTVLDFPEGISGVVGPNGCGKSNVVDAIRWVLGEMRVTMLRGKKMEDVIFNGSEDAPPVGMAEVTMVLEKGPYTFPGAYADCAEVMISRRLFRSGESEYSINSVPVRLLDVREFFMDTGVGARTYSLVEQGSIASMVEAKPEERRAFIEEAAGIAKYRSRKESALRKMESTRTNVTRLNDILREVKTQLNQISRQARRAEKFKALRGEIRDAEIKLCLQGRLGLVAKKEELKRNYSDADARATEARTKLADAEASILAMRTEIQEGEEAMSGKQERVYALRNDIGVREKGIEFSKGRIVDLRVRRQKDEEDIQTLGERKLRAGEEIGALERAAEESLSRIDNLRLDIDQRTRETEELRAGEESLRREVDEKKVHYFDIQAEKARLKNILGTLSKSLEDLRRRTEKDSLDFSENETRSKAVAGELERTRAELDASLKEIEGLKSDESGAMAEIGRYADELSGLDGVIAGLKEDLGRQSSRLASLREFQNGHEWCSDGIRSVLRAREEGNLSREAFFGLVADHIDVPEPYEVAVEAVLGEKLQYIIVRSQEEGIQAIDYLKTATAGRGSFVPLRVKGSGEDLNGKDYLRNAIRLIDVVHVKDDFRSIADYLLGDILLVPDIKEGVSLWQRNGFRGTFVTPDGDTISPHGVLTGGSRTVTEDTSLLRKKREISALEAEVGEIKAALEDRTANRVRAAALIEEKGRALENLRGAIRDLELRVTGGKKDVERLEGELRWLGQRLSALSFSRESMCSEEKEMIEKVAAGEADITVQGVRGEEVNALILQLQKDWEEKKRLLEEKEKALTDGRVRLASLEEKRNADLKALSNLSSLHKDMTGEAEARQRDLEECDRTIGDVTGQITADEKALGELYAGLEEVEKESALIRERHEEKVARLAAVESEEKELKRNLDDILREVTDIDIRIRETTFEIDALQSRVLEKYNTDLNALAPEFIPMDEEAVNLLREKLDRGKEQVESFGEVNLLAIGEYEELKQRHDFLVSQITDLEASLETLQKTIARINQISRTRFAEAFDAVNECFKLIFPKLFRGGRGMLRLTDSEDMLETGVDIEIQLPGKRMQSVNLLSGGEKSLSAVALIFSIILYRPTPFLVLDEVDAALDDANIALFNQFLKEIAEKSQIILVTHNKNTMEVASNLYGVSMEKKGISNLVSVNLRA